MVFHKALEKTLFHFFSALGSCAGKKNESVFCASAIEIQIIFFVRCRFFNYLF
jgi:hypothetical protein